MNGKRFDALTRLTTRAPRRRVLAGFLAASATILLGTREVTAEPGDYDSRGQRCTVFNAETGTNDCNSPCRYCRGGRCVYACDDAREVCDASLTGCPYTTSYGRRVHINKGCCVPRTPYP